MALNSHANVRKNPTIENPHSPELITFGPIEHVLNDLISTA